MGWAWFAAACPVGALASTESVSGADSFAEVDVWVAEARQRDLAAAPDWASLLHVSNGNPNIPTSDFLLSLPDFSLDAELAATLRFLYSGDASHVCRFPARYLWLRHELSTPALPVGACAELAEFKARAPADTMAIVFASENLSKPASMMGHILFKLSGRDHEGRAVEHAVSFITDTRGVNLPRLFFDSMVIGIPGFFTLSPYAEKVDLYLREEQRSLWEYELQLDPVRKEWVIAHLMELKQTALTYFFEKYNCATVVDFILSLGAGQQLDVAGFWLTPKDVVKRAHGLNLVRAGRVVPPSRWLIRALSAQMSAAELDSVKEHVDRLAPLPDAEEHADAAYFRGQLAKAYHARRFETKRTGGPSARAYGDYLNSVLEMQHSDQRLQAVAFKNPVDAPQDSQVELGLVHRGGQDYLRVSLTPTSHRLIDDNRQYFAESEMVLFDVSVLNDLASHSIVLDRLTLYGTKSLIPYDPMSGGVSGAIQLGMEQRPDDELHERNAVYVAGALGITRRFGLDVDVFTLAGMGVAYQGSQVRLYLQPELGVIVREVFDMKSTASVVLRESVGSERSGYRKYQFVQSKYLPGGKMTLLLTTEWERVDQHRRNTIELGVKYLF